MNRHHLSTRAASASRLPSVSSEFVHRHRLARATKALASHCESELGRHAARCLVLSLVDVRSDAVGFGPTPEVADGGVHGLGRDPVIAPLLGYPPARLDLVRLDPIDAISSQAQLRASEEPLLSQIPDRPGAESALPPLHLSRANVAQRVSRPARRRCVLGFIEPRQRSQEQPFRPENDPAVDSASPVSASPFHTRSMSPPVQESFQPLVDQNAIPLTRMPRVRPRRRRRDPCPPSPTHGRACGRPSVG